MVKAVIKQKKKGKVLTLELATKFSEDKPAAPGEATAGISEAAARSDHVHPAQSIGGGDIAVLHSAAGSRTSAIAPNVKFVVPSYIVNSKRLELYIDGQPCICGPDAESCSYAEVGADGTVSTNIIFHQSIPTTIEIIARVS